MFRKNVFSWMTVLLLVMTPAIVRASQGSGPLKVFILAGQSNMEGHAHMRTMDYLGEDPQYGHLLKKVKGPDGAWIERKDVWIYYKRGDGKLKKGNLTASYGASDNEIGPELMLGNILGDHYENQVLLIKTAWGGRSLAFDFRPPSSGEIALDKFSEKERLKLKENIDKKLMGKAYNDMISEVKNVLGNLKEQFPEYDGKGYELAGFVWVQGWNDMINTNYTAEYATNLTNMIKDVRKDLQVPNLPFAIGEMGIDGKDAGVGIQRFRKAQAEGVAAPEFKDNVELVTTKEYWDEKTAKLVKEGWEPKHKWPSKEMEEEFNKLGSQPGYHYLGSAKIYSLMGMALAESIYKLSKK